jgi:hypothetical protein
VVHEHRQRLVQAARKHGKTVAMLTDGVAGVRQMIALGATIINYSSDAAVLRSSYAPPSRRSAARPVAPNEPDLRPDLHVGGPLPLRGAGEVRVVLAPEPPHVIGIEKLP